jgi:hypothetical protein
MKREDFLGCSDASIACTGSERLTICLARYIKKGTMDIAMWCLNMWPIMISGFSTDFFWLGRFLQ